MIDILNIGGEPIFDALSGLKLTCTIRTSTPRLDSDEIRISIQQQYLYTLPCESVLSTSKEDWRQTKKMISSQRLDKIALRSCLTKLWYELNGTEIDHKRNVGITSLMKSCATHSGDFAHYIENYIESRISESGIWLDREKTNNTWWIF